MTDVSKKVELARKAMTLTWTAEREGRIAKVVQVRRRRRAVVRTAAVCAAIALAPLVWRLNTPALAHDATTALAASDSVIVLDEGSSITAYDANTKLAIHSQQIDEVEMSLRRGGARFDIVHNEARRFTVHVDTVTVHVLGTQFSVERVGDAVVVAVAHGTVRVEGPHGSALVVDGEVVRVPMHDVAAKAPIATLKSPSRAKADVISHLFAEADSARASADFGHAALALDRIVATHANDDRAPMAAFILGRLRSEKLNDACAAQTAFAKVYSLAPQGPLASDARTRAREAQALCLR